MDAHPLPDAALDDRLAFVGTAGSGKTYAAGTVAERLLSSGARIVIVDPLDVWWGLRLLPSGDAPSPYSVAILGGAHGDLALHDDAGAVIGAAVARSSQSAIVSLGGLPTKAAERRFMRAFLEAVYDQASGEPVHLVFDEADLWAPQRATGETAVLLGRMDEIVRRGRVRGLIPWLITQRPAVIAKDVLSQMDGMVAMKLTGPHDRAAIADWIAGSVDQATSRKIIEPLATFQRGEGVLWVPARDILERVQFPAKETYDSSRTPTRGEARRTVKPSPIDIEGLRTALAVEKPAALQKPNSSAKSQQPDPQALADAEQRGYERARVEIADERAIWFQRGFEAASTDIKKAADAVLQGDTVLRHLEVWRGIVGDEVGSGSPAAPQPAAAPAPKDAVRHTRPSKPPAVVERAAGDLTPALQRALDAIAWWHKIGHAPIERGRAAVVAGLSPKASTFGGYVADLVKRGLVAASDGKVGLTNSGLAIANMPAAATRRELHDMAIALLSPAEARAFEIVYRTAPHAIERRQVAEHLGLSPKASTTGGYLSAVAGYGLIENAGPGMVRAAGWLFPERRR